MKDYYAILGLQRSASQAEIKQAYRRLAVSLHPDKNPDPAAEELFKEINEAYDVVGDPEKRKAYDYRLDNPFAEILEESVQPRHRDPAYRRKYPSGYQPNRKPTTKDLIAEYIGYFKWATYVGFALTLLLGIDYVLPYKMRSDQVQEIYVVSKSRFIYSRSPVHAHELVYAYEVVVFKSEKTVRMYNHEANHYKVQDNIRLYSTLLFSEAMSVTNLDNNYSASLGYFYHSAVVLIPLALFIITLLAVILRNRIEFLFNVSIISIVLIIIVLYLIFTL